MIIQLAEAHPSRLNGLGSGSRLAGRRIEVVAGETRVVYDPATCHSLVTFVLTMRSLSSMILEPISCLPWRVFRTLSQVRANSLLPSLRVLELTFRRITLIFESPKFTVAAFPSRISPQDPGCFIPVCRLPHDDRRH